MSPSRPRTRNDSSAEVPHAVLPAAFRLERLREGLPLATSEFATNPGSWSELAGRVRGMVKAPTCPRPHPPALRYTLTWPNSGAAGSARRAGDRLVPWGLKVRG